MLKVICDNRLRLVSGLTAEVSADLIAELTYKNPQHYKLVALGYKHNVEPKTIAMWSRESGVLTLPRGAMQILRNVLSAHGVEYEVEDRRTAGDASVTGSYLDPWGLKPGCEFPPHKLVMWDHQRKIVDAIKTYQQCLLRSPTGCISGDAMIGVNRAGKGSQMRLDHVVTMFNGGVASGRTWNLSIPTMVRARLDDGTIGLVQLRDAYVSGTQPVFEVVTRSGHRVLATHNHRFLTESGWKRLEHVLVGERVEVEQTRRPVPSGRVRSKPWYKLRVAKHHPFVGRLGVSTGKGGATVPEHRLVAEAYQNGLALDEFIERCNVGDIGLTLANIAVHTALSEVVSIKLHGDVPTYDLTLDEPHNFLANGMVVHNSGKTSAVIAAIVELGVPALVIMWDSGLLKQWQERIVSELGIPVHEQGLIRGPVCRLKGITLAMQQTLHTWTDTKWDQILPVFGLVACDEVQRYAASTFTKQVDRFPAKYRIGVSADERRKDGKEFVIYSMFGQVKLEVSKKELVDKQLIHEVEVFVVPTAFNAPWYAESIEVRKDAIADGKRIKTSPQNFTNLITEMQQNKARNQLALSMIKECVDAGLPTLTFTHRVDHAKMLDAMVSGQGIAGGLALGGDDWSDQFDATVAGLRDGSLMVGCGTFGKLGVGHDIPTVAAGIVVTPVHNNRAFFGQVKGRICRTSQGKQNARVIVLWDWKVFGLVPIFNMRKWNSVMRVWCEWDKRWKDVDTFLLEVKRNGRYSTTKDSPEESTIGGLFGTVR